MVNYNPNLIQQLVMMYASLGIIFSAIVLHINTLSIYKEKRYATVLFISLISFTYILWDVIVKHRLLNSIEITTIQNLYYYKSLTAIFFLSAIPLFLNSYIYVNKSLSRINRILIFLSLLLSAVLLILGIAKPSLLKATGYIEQVYPFNFIKTEKPPILYRITDLSLLLLLGYTVVNIFMKLLQKGSTKAILALFWGTLFSSYFFIKTIIGSLWGMDIPTIKGLPLDSITFGLTVLTLLINWTTLRIFLRESHQVQETKKRLSKSQENLIQMAYTDDLTQLGNRTAAIKDLKKLFQKKTLNSAAILMDLNHFMDINESYGNDKGDVILRLLAQRFVENLPTNTKIYRVGGDEFLFLIEEVHHKEMPKEMGMLINNWINQGIELDDQRYRLSGAFAYCLIPNHGKNVYEVVRNLNSTLKIAKKQGSTIEIFDDSHYTTSINHIEAVKKLKKLIKEKSFRLVYQPLVDKEGVIFGVEALLRSQRPILGYDTPDRLISLAESAGLMEELTGIIITQFSVDYKKIAGRDNKLTYHLNLSGKEFFSKNICQDLSYHLYRIGFPMENLYIEITESILMEHWSKALRTINSLGQQGVRITLDNFGQGFSSLKYLHQLPIQSLKLDGEFHRCWSESDKYKTLMKHMVSLIHELDIQFIAGGVETEEQRDLFLNLGCKAFQGFFYYPPLELEDLLSKLS